jgi:predicted NodU family carbamoyl transferase
MNLSVIVSAQRISAISRGIRTNSDYFVIFNPFSIGELEQFIEQFVAKSQRKEFMQLVMNVFETKHQFIMVDNTEPARHKLKTSKAQDFIKGNVTPLIKD